MKKSINNRYQVAIITVWLFATACLCRAEEAKFSQVQTALSSTILSGYISTSASINFSRDGFIPTYFSANIPDAQAVPEPSSVALLTLGGAAVILVLRRRMNRR